ncbi:MULTISPECIES: DNA polymerase I [unclassified Ruminococcus]|uniref:DNA polymerase I n=1 Tax=unclassified Ruminococcus TaxID=2608920 RepID=UPI00210EEDFD|nr:MULTISPECIES: DNA polymerase I [unclassified Ruminococcus]MCQ4022724.1 DNA polymerase I [Ruminococcus sp. zg-924]MCQ4114964.1 DNA polymerase I [Ruminococcus sp. zg-921]
MKLLVLDGNSILNRAFYGIKLLTTKDGTFTNAVYGFMTMLIKIKEDVQPDAVAVAFDLKAPTFRHKKYDGYKANRKPMPAELASQMPIIKELLIKLGYKTVECEGFEADDILGTLAKACEDNGCECVLATGDRDSLQLVSESVTVRLAATKMGRPDVRIYDEAKIAEDYGVSPKQLIDIKAIQGDTSDNIPGVKGIGEKGAGELIRKFGSLDGVYENIDSADIKPAMRKKLEQDRDNAYLSLMLGEIAKNAPIDTELSHYVPTNGDKQAAAALMARLEFFSLIKKLGLDKAVLENSTDNNVQQCSFKVVCDTAENIINILSKTEKYAVAYNSDGEAAVAADSTVYLLDTAADDDFYRSLFSLDSGVITDSVKPLYKKAAELGVDIKKTEMDTSLAAYLLNPSAGSYDAQRLIGEYGAQAQLESDNELASKAAGILLLSDILLEKIKSNGQESLLYDIEIPLAAVLARMEHFGFAVDRQGIEEYGKTLERTIDELQNSIYDDVGYIFNINSPKQLGTALFEKLMLPMGKKTKTGYSTSADVLEGLRPYHPCIDKILSYRTLAKLKSTYCDGLLKVISDDGRIHSSFNQTETRTGRISSTEPNLQNIPVRTPQGRELRKFFVAKEGCVLVDADYSQIELRVLADIAKDKNMIAAFNNNEDIHAITASQVFNMPLEMVNSQMRSRAKAVNFGIVYGIGAFSLSKDIGVTRKEADRYIKSYLSHYSGVARYMDNVVAQAKEKGYVQTVFNRRRYLPELKSSNFNTRSFGERVARNMPIQGTAADVIKIAMIRVDKRLREENMSARLILQVHDELIVEAPNNEAMKAAMILQQEMENAVKLSVPLTADASMGKSWYDAKG